MPLMQESQNQSQVIYQGYIPWFCEKITLKKRVFGSRQLPFNNSKRILAYFKKITQISQQKRFLLLIRLRKSPGQ